VAAILDACEKGEVKTLYLLGTELFTHHPEPDRVRRALARVEHVIVHSTHRTDTLELASIVLPDATHLEMDGTFVNYQGRVQLFRRAFPPNGQASPAAAVLAEIGKRLGASVPSGSAEKLFDEMSAAEPAFGSLRWKEVGLLGAMPGAPEAVGAGGSR
jgi:formate dehydrogenase major subunit